MLKYIKFTEIFMLIYFSDIVQRKGLSEVWYIYTNQLERLLL